MAEVNDTSSNQPAAAGSAEVGQIDKRFEQLNQQLSQMSEQMAQALSKIQTNTPKEEYRPAIEETAETFLDLKPKEFVQDIDKRVEQKINEANTQMLRRNQAIAQLVAEYPEATDTSNPMYKKVLEMHSSLPANLQETPEGYELAVSKAARMLGIAPKSARQTPSNDGFSFSSKSSGAKVTSKKVELDDATLELAARVGMNINDPKVVERLQQRAQRKSWGRYE